MFIYKYNLYIFIEKHKSANSIIYTIVFNYELINIVYHLKKVVMILNLKAIQFFHSQNDYKKCIEEKINLSN